MKNLRSSAYAALLLALASMGLQAQDSGFGVSAAFLTGAGRTESQAGVKSGLALAGHYTIPTSNGYDVRAGFAANLLIGSGVEGVDATADADAAGGANYMVPGSSIKHQFTNIQVFGDVVVPIYDKHADWIIGLSVNKYMLKVSGAPDGAHAAYSPFDLDAATRSIDPNTGALIRTGSANGSVTIPGVKLGVRMGADYHFSKNLSAQVLFQATELGRITSLSGQLPTLNPAWLEFGVTYKF
jgi:hypothetical protein